MTTVLIADDSETILLLMRTRLELAGYEVETAADGQEVTDLVDPDSDEGPDLLLLDAMMPRKSGIDALRELRAAGLETPALIVSAHQDPDDADAPADLEISGYLTKPIDFDLLLGTVAELTEKKPPRPGGAPSSAQLFATSRRISLPFSLVPSRNSTVRSAWSGSTSTKEKRWRTRTSWTASSGRTAPSRSAQRRSSSSMPLRSPRLTKSLVVFLPSPSSPRLARPRRHRWRWPRRRLRLGGSALGALVSASASSALVCSTALGRLRFSRSRVRSRRRGRAARARAAPRGSPTRRSWF